MISAIITAFNSEAYLAQGIESVLNQTLVPAEILVADDGSTDATAAIAKRYGPRVLYRWQENQGPGGARMLGIRETSGDFLAFLDSDDIWLPRKLELQYAAVQEEPSLDLVFPHLRQFLSPDLKPEVAASLVCDERPHASSLISGFFGRRSVFERVGPLFKDMKADFVDWYLRAREAGVRMKTLDEVLVMRRIHPGNFTLLNKDVRHEYLHVLKASLDRRRSQQGGAKSSEKG
jgi:glycosyltransferase involved in cell wall biosynthesis